MGRQLGWVWFGKRRRGNEFLLIINANYAQDDVFDVQFNGQSIGVADFSVDGEPTWIVYTWEDTDESVLIEQIVDGFVGDNVNGWPIPSARVIRDRVINGFYKVSLDVPFFDVNNLRMQAISSNFNNNFGWILPGVIIDGISYVKYYEYRGSNFMDVTYSIEWPTGPS